MFLIENQTLVWPMQAFKDYPEIDQHKCIMIGNKLSDMRFGRAAGMFTIFITTQPIPIVTLSASRYRCCGFPALLTFAEAL